MLTPFKLITVFLHEASHAIACKLTCGEVINFSLFYVHIYSLHLKHLTLLIVKKLQRLFQFVNSLLYDMFGWSRLSFLDYFLLKLQELLFNAISVWQFLILTPPSHLIASFGVVVHRFWDILETNLYIVFFICF